MVFFVRGRCHRFFCVGTNMSGENQPIATATAIVVEEEVHDEQPFAPTYFKSVDLDAAFVDVEPIEKSGTVYVAKLRRPLVVQTPPLVLASPLEEEDQPLTHAHLVLPQAFADFAHAVEAKVLSSCLANKAAWFRRPMDDDSLRAGFKAFCRDKNLKIKLPRDVLVFDSEGRLVSRADIPQGATIRCLLELSRISFGRTEFGSMWSLLQAQTAPPPRPPPKCMIDPAVEEEQDAARQEGCPEDDTPDFF